ncbi:MAG: helix-turn-helix domain-containing protein, partial [Nitrospira sp.]|nr:helix-turn-helix domain-containing protein [Nitrospira sp.]
IREEFGWTQDRMAIEIGVTANTIARWERGEIEIYEPAARLLTLLAQSGKRGGIAPFDRFIEESLKGFARHLEDEEIKGAFEQRMRGAREFALYLLGRPHKKGQRTKGTI